MPSVESNKAAVGSGEAASASASASKGSRLLLPPLSATRSLFLRSVSLCYLCAFASLYPQIAGLYGTRGVVPAVASLNQVADFNLPDPVREGVTGFLYHVRPNLLKVLPGFLGLSVDLTMDLLCIVGVALALAMSIRSGWCHKLHFLTLWLVYFSLYNVGGTFLHFQWDILLLETGFLCIIVAPLTTLNKLGMLYFAGFSGPDCCFPWDRVTLFLVRWLLFRMMFSSGVVKLLSQSVEDRAAVESAEKKYATLRGMRDRCEAWWGLTALPVHYESQCIPTWLAWYAYWLPDWLHKVSVIGTYVIEIPLTFLFFAPTKELRVFTFMLQNILMVSIMVSGNYNFFNFLYMGLCLSLMDDTWLDERDPKGQGVSVLSRIRYAFNRIVYVGLIVAVSYFFFKFDSKTGGFIMATKFNQKQFDIFVRIVGEGSVGVGLVLLAYHSFLSFLGAAFGTGGEPRGGLKRAIHVVVTLCYIGVAFVLFGISTPRYLLGMNSRNVPHVPKELLDFGQGIGHLEITHSYGLFRRMTGIGGRPEVVVEGAMSEAGPWREFHFRYKPTALDAAPPVAIPHQPRLDWQMWFAALGSYQHNPWFVSMMYRLLKNEPDVVNLLDVQNHPFSTGKAPKYVRAQLYHYHFTNATEKASSSNWWKRDLQSQYFPSTGSNPSASSEAVSLDQLKEYLKANGYLSSTGRDLSDPSPNTSLANWLRSAPRRVQNFPHHLFAQTLFVLASMPFLAAIRPAMKKS